MKSFKDLQSQLQTLLPMPSDLPVVYLLGDTGAGKTCFVRQLLGTTDQSFPHVRRFRTTVAPTEFIITNEPELKAAFVFKSQEDIFSTSTRDQSPQPLRRPRSGDGSNLQWFPRMHRSW
jgi:ABC-type phosphate/phosphonate transport system ATPase subunit